MRGKRFPGRLVLIAAAALMLSAAGAAPRGHREARRPPPGHRPIAAAAEEAKEMNAERVIVDFSTPGETDLWGAVNDGVMGGLSESHVTQASDSTAVFGGILSLENNGGFASVRRAPAAYPLADATALVVEVKGDGRRYQLRARTDDRFDGVAYRAFFETADGQWRRIEIPFDEFQATFRGQPVPEAPALDPPKIRQLGFLIADKRSGSFRLEIRRITARSNIARNQQL